MSVHFKSVLQNYGVTLNVGRGFSSWSAVKETADRYRRIEQNGDKEVTLLAFSDFDPSGEDMIRDLRERLGHPLLPGGGVHPEIVKCALHLEDIQRYNLPPDFTKASDSRAAEFVARYGDVAVELDALDVPVLRDRLQSEVERRLDLDALQHTKETQRGERQRLHELSEELRGGLEGGGDE